MRDIDVGERYSLEQLPENDMNNSGKVEWVGDDILALAVNGKLYEFKMAVECTSISRIDNDGEIEVLDGELRG